MSSSGPCAHSPAPCSSIRRITSLACHLGPVLFTDEGSVLHQAHVAGMKESGDTWLNVMLPITSSSMTDLALGH